MKAGSELLVPLPPPTKKKRNPWKIYFLNIQFMTIFPLDLYVATCPSIHYRHASSFPGHRGRWCPCSCYCVRCRHNLDRCSFRTCDQLKILYTSITLKLKLFVQWSWSALVLTSLNFWTDKWHHIDAFTTCNNHLSGNNFWTWHTTADKRKQ